MNRVRVVSQLFRLLTSLLPVVVAVPIGQLQAVAPVAGSQVTPGTVADRLPVDLAVSPDGGWLVTANQGTDSVSLIRVSDHQVCDEIAVGSRPADIEFVGSGNQFLVTSKWSGEVSLIAVESDRLQLRGSLNVGFHPEGIAVDPVRSSAYVCLMASGQVVEIDWKTMSEGRRVDVGKWPRYLTISRDGKRLAVGCSGDSNVTVMDAATMEILYDEPLANGINLGHMWTDKDSRYAYFTWMVYRSNPITVGNIRRGWVLASRIGRVRLDGPAYREAISLDVPGKAVADPLGLVVSEDEKTLVASASGTHELLVYQLPELPFVGTGGPGDLIDRRLQNDRRRFGRIPVGGRPMGLRISADNRTVWVANYLLNSVQVVDVSERRLIREIALGSSEPSLAHQGMSLFYDGTRSLDQWYSCHSCHQDGGINSRPMDTLNDGTEMTMKTVLPLYQLAETGPWTWHGWQTDLKDAMHKSFTSTMQGKAPTDGETEALLEFLSTLRRPPNPHLVDGQLSESARRGKVVFESAKAGCADCHHGPLYSDGLIHDVGLGSKGDRYKGYNTPSLIGVHAKLRLLHSGRAKDLDRVVNDLHSPERVNGEGELNEQEASDLIEYLRSL